MDPEVITAHAYRVVIDDRIAQLWRYRRWWRTHRWAEHPLRRQEMDVELRALVRLARKARDLSRPALERADAVTAAKALRDPRPLPPEDGSDPLTSRSFRCYERAEAEWLERHAYFHPGPQDCRDYAQCHDRAYGAQDWAGDHHVYPAGVGR